MDAAPNLILASASPRRASLLRAMGLSFTVAPSHADEVEPTALSPAEAAIANACRKATQVAREHPDALVLGADTVVSTDGVHLGKPRSREEAEAMLLRLQGRVHQVATGVCLMQFDCGFRRLFADTTAVTFRPLELDQIRRYLENINPLDKAGGYAIQEGGAGIIESIHGSFANVVGLPVERLRVELGIAFEALPAMDKAKHITPAWRRSKESNS
jgi:septum formation protein